MLPGAVVFTLQVRTLLCAVVRCSARCCVLPCAVVFALQVRGSQVTIGILAPRIFGKPALNNVVDFARVQLEKSSDCWAVRVLCQYLLLAKLYRCSSLQVTLQARRPTDLTPSQTIALTASYTPLSAEKPGCSPTR